MTAIERLIQVAGQEVGYLEKRNGSNLYDRTTNAGNGNYTKYWAEIKPEWQGQPWCACFVTWCMVQAFGREKTEKLLGHYPYTYVPTLAGMGNTYSSPRAGDIVCFRSGGEFTHTGIVTGVNGDSFTTVEGNTSGGSSIVANGGGVCRKSYRASQLSGTRYYRPDYSIAEPSLSDIAGHYAEQHIRKLAAYGVVKGYEDGTFQPERGVSRAEMAEMIANALEKACGYRLNRVSVFPDVSGHWAQGAVEKLSACGIVNGNDDGLFHPDEAVTRGQAAVMVCNMLLYCGKEMKEGAAFPDTVGHYAERHIRSLRAYGVVNGNDDGTFGPDETVTRGQAAIMAANGLTILGK